MRPPDLDLAQAILGHTAERLEVGQRDDRVVAVMRVNRDRLLVVEVVRPVRRVENSDIVPGEAVAIKGTPVHAHPEVHSGVGTDGQVRVEECVGVTVDREPRVATGEDRHAHRGEAERGIGRPAVRPCRGAAWRCGPQKCFSFPFRGGADPVGPAVGESGGTKRNQTKKKLNPREKRSFTTSPPASPTGQSGRLIQSIKTFPEWAGGRRRQSHERENAKKARARGNPTLRELFTGMPTRLSHSKDAWMRQASASSTGRSPGGGCASVAHSRGARSKSRSRDAPSP